ncbi:MAG: helix-turn-helix transcriptional regulator [Lentisphaeria bacterium]|nr:helix-turn-helix transcriptional regulator [Lentisphaeria bacterium]
MLAVVKTPRIELSLSGAEEAVSEVLAFLRSRYAVAVLNDDDSGDTDAFQTPFWRKTSPGDLLQGYRLKHGLSQEALSEKTGIRQSVLSAYETGRRPLSRRAAIRIGNALDEDPDKFFPETAVRKK